MQGSESNKSKTVKKSKTLNHTPAQKRNPFFLVLNKAKEANMKKFIQIATALVGGAVLLTLAACGGGGDSPAAPQEQPQSGGKVTCLSSDLSIDYVNAAGVKQTSCHAKPSASTMQNNVWGWVRPTPSTLTMADLPVNDFDMSFRAMPSTGLDGEVLDKKSVIVLQDADPRYLWLHFRAKDTQDLYLKKVLATSRESANPATSSMSNGSNLGMKSYLKMEQLAGSKFRISMVDGGCRLVQEGPIGQVFTPTTGC
jgi:hypothetical protein